MRNYWTRLSMFRLTLLATALTAIIVPALAWANLFVQGLIYANGQGPTITPAPGGVGTAGCVVFIQGGNFQGSFAAENVTTSTPLTLTLSTASAGNAGSPNSGQSMSNQTIYTTAIPAADELQIQGASWVSGAAQVTIYCTVNHVS